MAGGAFLVWSEALACPREHGAVVHALDPAWAAQAYAHAYDLASDHPPISTGRVRPTVAVEDATGEVQRFEVSGRLVPEYSAVIPEPPAASPPHPPVYA